MLVPFDATDCPGIHVVHFVQVCAFLVVENLPEVQPWQDRSTMLVPSATTNCPRAQVVQLVQVWKASGGKALSLTPTLYDLARQVEYAHVTP